MVLVGVRGSGKTTLGSMLARAVGAEFLDLDDLVEQAASMSIQDIFTGPGGEKQFRKLESSCLKALLGRDNIVVATGGGSVISEENRRIMKELGTVIWLKVSPREAASRTKGSNRPRLTNLAELEEAEFISGERRPLYMSVADAAVDTGGRDLQDVLAELLRIWKSKECHRS